MVHKHDLIESAISRSNADNSGARPVPLDSGRLAMHGDHDQAIKRRLHQLEAAQASHAVHRHSSHGSASAHHALGPGRGAFSGGALLLTAFVSAIAGAVLMWLTLGVAMNNSQPQPVLAAAPAVLAGTQLPPPVVSASEAMPVSVPAPVQQDIAESQVREMVEGWRLAWERRDVQVYLQYYGPQFVAANGQTRPDWDKGRQRNFSGLSWIRVDVKEMRTERIDENQIKVFFMQDYASDVYKEASQPKTLLIERRDNKWEIAGEWQGNK